MKLLSYAQMFQMDTNSIEADDFNRNQKVKMSWLKGLTPFKITFCQKLSYILCCFRCVKSGRQRRIEALINESESRMESMLDIVEYI